MHLRTMPLIFIFALCLCRVGSMFDEQLDHNVLDTELCVRHLETMKAFGFHDSSFHVPQGLLKGKYQSYFGNYQQCLAINENFQGTKVEGKYCLINVRLTFPTSRIPLLGGVSDLNNLTWTELRFDLKDDVLLGDAKTKVPETGLSSRASTYPDNPPALSLGLCVPKTCTVDAVLRPYVEHPLIRFNYSEGECRLLGDKPYLGADYTGLVVFLLLGLLTVISTAYELNYLYRLKKDPAKASELLQAFSLYGNTSRLFSFTEPARPLDCLNGIRALSVLWIIILHTGGAALVIYTTIFSGVDDLETINAIKRVHKAKFDLWLKKGEIAVDSFFVLSGLLLVYTTANKVKKLTLKNLPHFYMNRYMRLFPLQAVAVLLQSSVLDRIVDGPEQILIIDQVENCRRYWWSALVHLQNYINNSSMCLNHTWYLSVDMQLYVASPVVLYWILRSPRSAWAALATAVLASLVATAAFCFYFNLLLDGNSKQMFEYKTWYYTNTVARSPPFFIGMLFGYLLHNYRREKLYMSKSIVFLCYSLALGLSLLATFNLLTLSFDNQVAINLHNALHRSCWALALCWLILACAHGYGGPVNWFLSLKLWQFVARISYAMYLFSSMIQFEINSSGVQYDFDNKSVFSRFAADLMFTLVFSVAACILVEAPITTLYGLLNKTCPDSTSTNDK